MKFNWLNNGTRLVDHLHDDTSNNFMLIRLLAALIVVKQHSVIMPEIPGSGIIAFPRLSILGLPSFFFISGLLVTESLRKSSSWKNFLWKRFLRLYPAAWLSVFFCAFILGPITTTWLLKDYFSSKLFFEFLSTAFLIKAAYYLPGVFEHSPMGTSSVNAPLWTICLELKLYIGLLIFWMIKIPNKKAFLIILVLVTFIFGQLLPEETDKLIYKAFHKHISIFGTFEGATFFLTGALVNFYKEKIVVKNYWLFIILFLFALIMRFHTAAIFIYAFVILVNLFVSTKGIHYLKKITPKPDLSYGIYIFAFPVQQIVANYFLPQSNLSFFFEALVFILPFAFFSWYIVERKALSLKRMIK